MCLLRDSVSTWNEPECAIRHSLTDVECSSSSDIGENLEQNMRDPFTEESLDPLIPEVPADPLIPDVPDPLTPNTSIPIHLAANKCRVNAQGNQKMQLNVLDLERKKIA